jgi:predicted nucleic acid-binding protein
MGERRRRSYLIDTDIFIDWLNGMPWAKRLMRSAEIRLYYSTVTGKELLKRVGLSTAERERILAQLSQMRRIKVDSAIATAATELHRKYKGKGLEIADATIAATAWLKRLPLLTRNKRHYEFIEEIELAEFPYPEL